MSNVRITNGSQENKVEMATCESSRDSGDPEVDYSPEMELDMEGVIGADRKDSDSFGSSFLAEPAHSGGSDAIFNNSNKEKELGEAPGKSGLGDSSEESTHYVAERGGLMDAYMPENEEGASSQGNTLSTAAGGECLLDSYSSVCGNGVLQQANTVTTASRGEVQMSLGVSNPPLHDQTSFWKPASARRLADSTEEEFCFYREQYYF